MDECRGSDGEVDDECYNKKKRAYNMINKTGLDGADELWSNGDELSTINASSIDVTRRILGAKYEHANERTQAE